MFVRFVYLLLLVLIAPHGALACCCGSPGGKGVGQCPPAGGCRSDTCDGACHMELSDASQCPKEAEVKKRATESQNILVRRCRSLP